MNHDVIQPDGRRRVRQRLDPACIKRGRRLTDEEKRGHADDKQAQQILVRDVRAQVLHHHRSPVASDKPIDHEINCKAIGVNFLALIRDAASMFLVDHIAVKRTGAIGMHMMIEFVMAVRDFSPPTLDQLEQFLKLVDESPPGTKIIVHCEGGTGRTGTFAAAYWITKGMTAAEAIMQVRKIRRHAVETPEQEAVLVEFATRIQRR
jgi:predicted protein tyrosine phosphatase